MAEKKCWSEFKNATADGANYVNRDFLPHKIYPILLLCEGLSLLLPLVIWYWCFGRELSDSVASVIDHSNNLTEYYRKYDKTKGRAVTEVMLHRELDNFLEYMAYLLITQSKRMFRLFVAKWVALLILTICWIAGLVALHMPNFADIFADKFTCVFGYDKIKRSQRIAECTIPTATLLRATWFANAALLGFLVIFVIVYVVVLNRRYQYVDTFMYRSIPGCMDKRLATCIQQFFNSRHFSLISRFCGQNTFLCRDVGMSRSLARKYGLFHTHTPGRGGIMDKHFPIIQTEQIEKFRLSAELFYLNLYRETTSMSQVMPVNNVDKANHQTKQKTTKPAKKDKTKIQPKDKRTDPQTDYLPPYALTRKLKQETKHLNGFTPRAGGNSPVNKSLSTNRSTRSDITLEDLEFTTSTPSPPQRKLAGTRKGTSGTNNLYGFHHGLRLGKIHPQTTDRYPKFVMRHRELDPYAFRMSKDMMRRKAEDIARWKP